MGKQRPTSRMMMAGGAAIKTVVFFCFSLPLISTLLPSVAAWRIQPIVLNLEDTTNIEKQGSGQQQQQQQQRQQLSAVEDLDARRMLVAQHYQSFGGSATRRGTLSVATMTISEKRVSDTTAIIGDDEPPIDDSDGIDRSITYRPGSFQQKKIVQDKYKRKIELSDGMTGECIAYSGENPILANGQSANDKFHYRADAAACFPIPGGNEGAAMNQETRRKLGKRYSLNPDRTDRYETTSGSDNGSDNNNDNNNGADDDDGVQRRVPFYYSSNAEIDGNDGGGVYTLEFDADGNLIDYFPCMTGTNYNCGGGRTPWGSWVTCEENGKRGYVWQIDPAGIRKGEQTNVVDFGGNFESFAFYHVPDERILEFFVTNDSSDGALVRFLPKEYLLEWEVLHGEGDRFFLKLDSKDSSGTFEWVTKASDATPELYPYSEGIDVYEDQLFFVSKTTQNLFTLHLKDLTFTRSSTKSGAFDDQPDQLKRILNDPHGILYFCEDTTSDAGVHGRDRDGNFFTILNGASYETESSGLAFSPDGMYMFLAYQGGYSDPGAVWKFWREDGLPFNGEFLDIKYHSS